MNSAEITMGRTAREFVVTVTANFTAEPIRESLCFWMARLGFEAIRLEFSGYNQVFQELMTPGRPLGSNTPGVNFLLIRLEDWARDQAGARAEAICVAAREFLQAFTSFAQSATRPTVLMLCPRSRDAASDSELAGVLDYLELEIQSDVAGLRGVRIITSDDLTKLYPVDLVDDPESDRQGHIPFTRAYWTALGTILARKARLLLSPPHKVIVVDADNTLWSGVVGEAGADQVRISDERLELQKLLRARKKQGMLLALVSKNEEADVAEVFRRSDMVLRREDFVAWKVNWEPKSRNVASLAEELELGLDSFLFLDDNPVECADVAANCSGVATLLVPSDTKQIPGFLQHVWPFDLDSITAVDEKRTELYRQQSERNQFRNTAGTFREFIDGLQLRVEVAPLSPADYDRAAQLTQRTNQFNNSGIRRTAAELFGLVSSGDRNALLVRARDRFGDYGEVGLAVFFAAGTNLFVESLLLSCRVLGKGVEYRVVGALGNEALRLGATDIVFPFKKTDRNRPAECFLKSIGMRRDDGVFHLTAAAAATLVFEPESAMPEEGSTGNVESIKRGDSHPNYFEIATELNSVEKILQAISRDLRLARPQLPNQMVRPRTLPEAKLARIWQEVLHVDEIGVTDSFLRLGGQSLQAVSIVSRIAAEFGVRIPVSILLADLTISELYAYIRTAYPAGRASALPKAGGASLSPAQQRLWFLDQFIPNRAAYNIPLGRRVRGMLNIDALQAAFSSVVRRHDALRSTFRADDGQTALKISEAPDAVLRRLSAASEAEALAIASEEARRPFDLAEGPLCRCLAISLGADDHVLVLVAHHIVSDGWSMGILMRDLTDAYASAMAGREPVWTPLDASYSDYAFWQQERLGAGDLKADLEYWKREMSAAPSLLQLPTDKPRPSAMTYVGGSVSRQVSAAARRTLEDLAERKKCTPFTVLLAAWQMLLHRYSQQEDIVVGVPVAGRSHASAEELVGCFVNTLAIRATVREDASFLSHLQKVRGKVLDGLTHQELPFEYLVSELGLERDLSRSPLFQVMLVLQNTPGSDFAAPGLKVTSLPLHNGGAKFDLVLEVTPVPDGYSLALEFNTSLFLPETAERILLHFTRLLESACASPERPLASLSMLDKDEVQQMLSLVNSNGIAYDNLACLHRSFERRVSLTPDAPALSYEGQHLSYQQANQRANQLAHYLIACGIGPDMLVGVCIDRTIDLVIAILGVLKAGGAYLPIDLSYPTDRLAFMLADARATVLLTEKKLLPSLPEHRARTICLDDAEPILSAQPATNPVTAVSSEHIAYVIYTSGSTGKPKGCMVTHRNVARLMRATEPWFGFNEHDVWTLFHSCAFDFSVWEIWGALLYGGRLVIVPFMVSRSPEAFYELIASEQVTVLNQTPSAFRQLIQAEESVGQRELALRSVIFGGEALEMQSLRPWFDRHGDQKPQLVNMYGITETTVHVTYRPLSKDDLDSGSVIGVPIPDLQVYILDPQLRPVPVGVPGEMYVGGAGLARGYLRRPELTAERFIPNPFTEQRGARLYKTGDLARFLPGRDIEYLGRIDNQVKIRGFRIELGEIESVLCQHAAVREAKVIAREDVPGTKRLAAYLVATEPAPDVSVLREHLKQKLPEYMVPAAFVFLGKLPLTNNGKIDQAALPAPEHRPELGGRYVAPRTQPESTLAAIWSKILRVEQVGVADNFFELGGDSILSIQVISMARREGLKLTPKLLFAHQTIAELAAAAGLAGDEPSIPDAASGSLPLTPIQHWFFEQNLDGFEHYNQAFLFEVAEQMERSFLEEALGQLSRQHDALRLRCVHAASGWRQFYSDSPESGPLSWTDIAGKEKSEQRRIIEAVASFTQASLNVESGPLWRGAYFDLGPDRPGRLLIVVHHLAVDGISWRPLLEDLETAYQQLKAGRAIQLPAKSTSFKTWAERLRELAGSESLPKELAYWNTATDRQALCEAMKALAIDEAFDKNTEGLANTLKVSLTSEETRALLQQIPVAYNTQINDVLLTALVRAWARWSGSRTLFTNLEGHGRESLFDDVDLSRTVGWFTSVFPVRLELPGVETDWQPGETLKSVKEQLRQIPQHGIGYGILRYLSAAAGLSAAPEPPMVFNYLGQFDQVVAGSKLFRFAEESTGPWHGPNQRRRYALETNGLVIQGRLELSWTYSHKSHSEASIRQLADEFLIALKELIAHCQSPEAGGRTPSDFPLARLNQVALDRLVATKRDIEDIYPLSPIQTLFYSAQPGAVHSSFDQWHCTLRGELNIGSFHRAWQETLRRHTILRSTIDGEGLSEPLQIVHRDPSLAWNVEDWRSSPFEEQEARWAVYLKEDRAQPLKLTECPAMRFALIRLSDERWKFLWSVPALLLDGWSWPLVFRDASRLYEALSKNSAVQLESARPYRDYLEWLSRQSLDEAQLFWTKSLAGFRQPTPLRAEAPDSNGSGERYVRHVVSLSAEATNALQTVARRLQLTLGTVVQAGWALLLHHQSEMDDVVFGAAFAGRPADLRGVESIVGPFVNSLPVRVAVNHDATAGEFLRQLHARLLELSPFQFTPLMEIQRLSEVPWRHRLFDSLVVFQNYSVDEAARCFGGRIDIAEFEGPVHTNYPIMLLAEPGTTLRLTLIYDRQSVARSTVERWARDLTALFERLPESIEKSIAELLAFFSPRVAASAPGKKRLSAQSQDFIAPQTEMERTIASVWQKMFGLDQVSIEDNFFDLGGYSLLLVQMHGRLRETLKAEFPIVTLFEHPTVRSLARHLSQPVTPAAQNGHQWRDRAERQRHALAQMRTRLKK